MRKILISVALVSMMCSVSYAAPVLWSVNNHSYEYVTGSLIWNDAKTQAESRGGYLATITSVAENSFLSIFNTGAGSNFAWIGGFQYDKLAEPGGHYRWVTTESWSYTNWGGIEPNSRQADEDYAMYNIGLSFAGINTGQWGDASATPSGFDPVVGYFVEYENGNNSVVPEPASMILFGIGSAAMALARLKKKLS